jgi:hypothetical protein
VNEQLFWNISPVVGQFLQHRFVQPHIHLCRIAHLVGRTTQLCGERFARSQATINSEKLEQVDNGGFPIELLCMLLREALQLGHYVD